MSDPFEDAKPLNYVTPPRGMFRIQSVATNAYLYTNDNVSREVHAATGTGEDQWFTAQSNESDVNQVSIRSVTTSEFIILDITSGNDTIVTSPSKGERAKLLLLAGMGSRAGQFRIMCPTSKLWIVAMVSGAPGVFKKPTGESENAWWQFVQKDPVLIGLTYRTSEGRIDSESVQTLNTWQIAETDKPNDIEIFDKKEVDHFAAWELPPGTPREVDGMYSMPIISNGRIVLGSPKKLQFTFGKSLKFTKEWTQTFKLTLPAAYQLNGSSLVTRAKIRVPFAARYRRAGEGTDIEFEVEGIYTGDLTHSYKFKVEYQKSRVDENLEGRPLS